MSMISTKHDKHWTHHVIIQDAKTRKGKTFSIISDESLRQIRERIKKAVEAMI